MIVIVYLRVSSFSFSFHVVQQADGQEVASVVSAQEIRVVAELLQISPEGLQKSITFKVTVSIKLEHPHLKTRVSSPRHSWAASLHSKYI